jgi:hypothetical protein
MPRTRFPFLALLLTAIPAYAQATQAASGPRNQAVGAVTAVNTESGHITLRSDKGEVLDIAVTPRTIILHLPPGVTDAQKGTRMTLGEIAVGDRVLAYYRGAAGEKAFDATSLVIRTKADLAEIANQELADWRKRGTVGIATAIDPHAKAITLKIGLRTVTVETNDQTQYHRYSLDSAKPADAKPSSFAEIKAGDQVHVLGNRNADGTSTTAESIYAGTFRQLAATITSINPAAGEMQVKDLATRKPLTIKVDPDSTMKKMDPETAAMLARRYGPGRGQPQQPGRGGGDIGPILDRLPAVPLSGLKAGDAVMISTTMGSDPSHVTVITLLAGVEALLTAAPNSARDIMSGWNLSAGGEGQ